MKARSQSNAPHPEIRGRGMEASRNIFGCADLQEWQQLGVRDPAAAEECAERERRADDQQRKQAVDCLRIGLVTELIFALITRDLPSPG